MEGYGGALQERNPMAAAGITTQPTAQPLARQEFHPYVAACAVRHKVAHSSLGQVRECSAVCAHEPRLWRPRLRPSLFEPVTPARSRLVRTLV
eukprot:scaffold105433_cov31-Tisochrysis_lutea.AAC.7